MTEAIAAFEVRGVGGRWGQDRHGMDRHALSGRTGRAEAPGAPGGTLRHLPMVAQAWREGDIGEDQAQAIAWARKRRTEAAMARDEEVLVAQAKELGFEDFSRVLAYWKQLADSDGAEDSEEEKKAARDVFFDLEPTTACGWAR